MQYLKEFEERNYINQLQEQQNNEDTEIAHGEADRILCAILCDLGLHEIVKEYDEIKKWYA